VRRCDFARYEQAQSQAVVRASSIAISERRKQSGETLGRNGVAAIGNVDHETITVGSRGYADGFAGISVAKCITQKVGQQLGNAGNVALHWHAQYDRRIHRAIGMDHPKFVYDMTERGFEVMTLSKRQWNTFAKAASSQV